MADDLHSLLRQLVAQSQENGRLLRRILDELSSIASDVSSIAANADKEQTEDDLDVLP